MATHEHGIHHSIDYIELPVTDLGAAQAFCGAAFGWEFVDYGPEYAGVRTAAEQGTPRQADCASPRRGRPRAAARWSSCSRMTWTPRSRP